MMDNGKPKVHNIEFCCFVTDCHMQQSVDKRPFQFSFTSNCFNSITHMPQICPSKVAVKGIKGVYSLHTPCIELVRIIKYWVSISFK